MGYWPKILAVAAAFGAVTAFAPIAAHADPGGNGNHYGWDKGDKGDKGGKGGGGGSKGAPGPIAGAGLPILLVAGGYVLVRRRRNRRQEGELLPTRT